MSQVRIAEMLHGGIRYEVVLGDHLRHNVYPPVPEYEPQATEAIAAVVDGEPERLIRLHSGAEVAANMIVDGLHLEEFVNYKREDPD